MKQQQEKESKVTSLIKRCTCTHEYQDARYGKGMRVHNKVEKNGKWRCTVCRNEKN